MARRSEGDPGALPVYARLALGMAVFGSATPVSKIVTGAMPVFVGSLLRVVRWCWRRSSAGSGPR